EDGEVLAVAAIEALRRPGGEVPRARAAREVRLHVGEAEDDLAAHAHGALVLDAPGHALHAGDVLGDALAHLAVAAGDGVGHLALAVDDLDGDAVELLGDEEVSDGAEAVLLRELLAAGEPGAQLALGDGLVERAHGDLVARLGPLGDELAGADLGEHRVRGVEVAELVLEGVVGGVGDLGVPGVVAGPVLLQAPGQGVGALPEFGVEVEAAGPLAGLGVVGHGLPVHSSSGSPPPRRAAASMSSMASASPRGSSSSRKSRASRISSGL